MVTTMNEGPLGKIFTGTRALNEAMHRQSTTARRAMMSLWERHRGAERARRRSGRRRLPRRRVDKVDDVRCGGFMIVFGLRRFSLYHMPSVRTVLLQGYILLHLDAFERVGQKTVALRSS